MYVSVYPYVYACVLLGRGVVSLSVHSEGPLPREHLLSIYLSNYLSIYLSIYLSKIECLVVCVSVLTFSLTA
jgi:hypothetical protein